MFWSKLSRNQIAMGVSAGSIIINTLLSVFKFVAGVAGNSAAMISDAVHSLSDGLSTIIVIVGIRISDKEPDDCHPYGHERMECVAAIILSMVLCATGVMIGLRGLKTIISGEYGQLKIPGVLALIAAIVSIVVKETMYWITRSAAQKIGSGAMLADAWHHRSDALSSAGSFVGILGARIGFPVMDPLACVVICVLIVKAAVDIFLSATRKMTDNACGDETILKIRSIILGQEGIIDIDKLMTRMFGERVYVDVEISCDGSLTLEESHEIAENVHHAIKAGVPDVKHCMIHVNPVPYDRVRDDMPK